MYPGTATPDNRTPRSWRSPWTLRILFIASVVGPLAIASLVVWQHRRNVEREAYDHVRYTLGLLHEHALRVFEVYDLVIDRVADRIEGLSWEEIRAREPELRQELISIKRGVEQVGSLFLVDPEGDVVVSAAKAAPRLNASDRGFFREQREMDRGTYIDHAVQSRVTGRAIFSVSRRRPSATGVFDGAIVLASEEQYWMQFYSTLRSELSPSASLVRAQGDTLVRFPPVEFGRARPSEQFMKMIRERDEAYYEVTSRADDSRRIVGYKKLDAPVYVAYTVSKAALLSRWRNDALMIGLAAAAGAVMLLAITFFLRQRMRSEWNLQTALADANRNLEANVARRTEELSRALREKDVLLREVHHRVKNNLQMIASIVRIVGRKAPADARPILGDVTRRIIAVGQVYDQVHKADDLARLELSTYLRSVCDQLVRAFGRGGITLRTQFEPVMVDIDTALPVGLVAQELVTNAFKHGLRGEGSGEILVRLARTGNRGVLTVRDSGRGLREAAGTTGSGLKLIEQLASQVGGTLKAKNRDGGGAQFRLVFLIGKDEPARRDR